MNTGITTKEASVQLRVGIQTVRKYCSNRVLNAQKINGRWHIQQKSISATEVNEHENIQRILRSGYRIVPTINEYKTVLSTKYRNKRYYFVRDDKRKLIPERAISF